MSLVRRLHRVFHLEGERLVRTSDNRLSNLRAASPRENQLNRKLLRNNKSGCSGVHFTAGRWKVQLVDFGKRVNLGQFKSKTRAIQVARQYRSQ